MQQSEKIKVCLCFFVLVLYAVFAVNAFAEDQTVERPYTFRIVQLSDSQPPPGDEPRWQQVLESVELVNSLEPDIVMFAGDITHSGTEAEFKRMKELLSKIEAPVHYVPGNHDTLCRAVDEDGSPEELRKKKLSLYHKYFGEDYWSVEHGDFQFVGYNCTDEYWPEISLQKKHWLLETFLGSNKPYKFIVTHYSLRNPKLDEVLAPLGVMGYMHGHNHTVEAYIDDITGRMTFCSGLCGGGPGNSGVMYFDVYEKVMVCFWKPVHGRVQPMGVFDLEERAKAVSRRKDVLDIPPYLQELKPTKVTIKWQTKLPPPTEVMLRKQGGTDFQKQIYHNMFRKKGEPMWLYKSRKPEAVLHEVEIENLTPDTKYEYYVSVETTEFKQVKSQISSFKTPPLKSDTVTFGVYGDNRSVPIDHYKITSAMAKTFGDKLDFCMHTGDLVGDGKIFEQWSNEFFNSAYELLGRVPLYPVLGNHEQNSFYYFNFFNLPGNERWYSFDRGPVHFIFLDAYFSSLHPDLDQYQWLQNDLQQNNKSWVVVALHAPFFSSGPHGGLKKDGTPAEKQIADLRQYILPLLEEHGVTIVFNGHDHLYERSQKGQIYFITAGGGGAPLYVAKTNLKQNPYSQLIVNKHHYCIVEANQNKFNLTVYAPSGEILDEVRLTKECLFGNVVK